MNLPDRMIHQTYESLPEDIKDYDRITVDTVLKAISELSQGGE